MLFITPLSQSWRSLKANRNYNIINILGLSLGLASTFILCKIILYEWNTDKFHKNYDQVCYSSIRATPLSESRIFNGKMFFRTDYSKYPEIKQGTEVSFDDAAEIRIDQNKHQIHLIAIDSVFPEMFDFPLSQGEYKSIVNNSNGIVLSKNLSEKLYGTIMSVGKTMEFLDKRLTVVGILDEFPGNSSLQFEAIVSEKAKDFWSKGSVEFIRLNDHADLKVLNEKIIHLGKDHTQFSESILEYKPYKNLYFNQNDQGIRGFIKYGNFKSLKILLLIALLLFAVSTFNYLNIYQVTLQKRAKEIGILCIHGAGKRFLAKLFLKENIISIGISALLVILLYSLLSPYSTVILGKELPVYPFPDLLLLLFISLVLILLTSAITALRYNRINPLAFIKVVSTGKKALLSRRISMVIQYTATIAMLIVSIFFIKQLNFMLHRDMGFNQNNIITIPFFTSAEIDLPQDGTPEEMKQAMEDYQLRRNKEKSNQQFVIDEIKKNPFFKNLCFGHSPLTNYFMPVKNMNSGQDFQDASIISVTPEFMDLYGLSMAEGRFFESDQDQSRGDKIVINQKAKQYLGIDDITKCQIANRYWGSNRIIGVVEDFATDHLSKDFQPLVLYYFDDKTDNDLMVEIAMGKEAESIEYLRALYKKVNPGMTFSYQFVKDEIAKLYTEDKKLVLVYSIFAIIALIISSLGLFSFSIYDVQQRFKEIGIRKANGSGTWETVFYLTKHILVLLAIAFVIAVPVAWYGILKYLDGFANKAPVSWWIFVLAGLFTLLISILTVIWQSYRAASRNPVEALRYE
ncbi:MAG TPA: hypothetical protein DC042_06425 [Bacteroidales bacterium]|nr:hypothetical protein [Bacteroidales bacterium]